MQGTSIQQRGRRSRGIKCLEQLPEASDTIVSKAVTCGITLIPLQLRRKVCHDAALQCYISILQ